MSAVIALSGLTSFGAAVSADEPLNVSVSASKLTGWQTVDGGKYYYGKDGKPLTGWKKIGGDTYYFNSAKNGKAVTGFVTISGSTYYFGQDGVMRTGWVKLSGDTYYFGNDGVMRTGTRTISGKTYTFGKDGKLSTSASKTKTAAKSSSKKSVSWGESSASVEKKLAGLDYFSLGPMIMVFNSDATDPNAKLDCTFYLFDDAEKLQMYGTMKEGVSSKRNSLEKSGYKLVVKENYEGNMVYLYTKGSVAVVVSDYVSEGVKYGMTMYLSPEITKEMTSGNTDTLESIFDDIGM